MMYKGWSNLSQVVTRRTYLRDIENLGRKENWWETVDRYSFGNTDGKLVRPGERDELIQLGRKRKGFPAGRGIWASGSPTHKKIGGAALNNPLHENTKILTREYGWIEIGKIEGEEVTVLSSSKLYARSGGSSNAAAAKWVKAYISHAEMHPCTKISYQDRAGHVYTVTASQNHRWFRKSTTKHAWERVTTEELSIGDILPRIKPAKNYKISMAGAQHGLFFGDGTRSNGELHQFGEENVAVLKSLFSYWQPGVRPDAVVVRQCPYAWGDIPAGEYRKDLRYIYGFLAGYFAADGYIHSTTATMSVCSARRDELEKIRELFHLVGIGTGEVYLDSKSSNFSEHRELYRLSINRRDVDGNFFLKPAQRVLWEGSLTRKQRTETLRVVGLERLSGTHRVLCATVPYYEQFVIEGYCLTSNCWYLSGNAPQVFSVAMDLLMLGGGVGMSVRGREVSQLPKIKRGVKITHALSDTADIVVEDSREGWVNLFWSVLESYFETGRSFSWSSHKIRPEGSPIRGFGGTASGPDPLIKFIEKVCSLLDSFAGEQITTVAAGDLLCMTGEMVKAGNVRRSAIILIGDAFDRPYLLSKRWDLGQIPSCRSSANYSVYASSVEELGDLFWETYENGEPFGIVNPVAIQKYGRMGELRADIAQGVNPCAEATLAPYEPCNLVENALPNLDDIHEFEKSARLLFRYAKRVTLENYHIPQSDEVIKRNRRVGVGITGCLQSSLYRADILDHVYRAIQKEDEEYSRALGVPTSIKTTVIKPSGTVSKMADCPAEGIHPGYSRYLIQRIRLASNDPLIPLLKRAGHFMEPERKFDGTVDPKTLVVDFYVEVPSDLPVADEHWDTWKQLEQVKFAQKYWADQAVSVTVYYRKEEIPQIKQWLESNLHEIKTISFLCHNDHGFDQAPKEAITKEKYEELSAKIRPIEDFVDTGMDLAIDSQECAAGFCPIK